MDDSKEGEIGVRGLRGSRAAQGVDHDQPCPLARPIGAVRETQRVQIVSQSVPELLRRRRGHGQCLAQARENLAIESIGPFAAALTNDLEIEVKNVLEWNERAHIRGKHDVLASRHQQ